MGKRHKILKKVISGSKNIKFSEITSLAEGFGFTLDRISGSHHIFIHPEITEIINLQDIKGDVKPYQMKQLLKIIEKYNLILEE